MMFGVPAAALAMYHTAHASKKKQIGSLMLAAGFAAFLTGVTEPLEFAFMFVAPFLFVVHAALTGLSLAVAAFFQWTAGFSFSAGLLDFFLSFPLEWQTNLICCLFKVLFLELFTISYSAS